MTAPDGYPDHPEKIPGEDTPYYNDPNLALYGDELAKPFSMKWLRFRLDTHDAGYVGRHPIVACVCLVGLAALGGTIAAKYGNSPTVPRDISSEARLLALKNVPALKALGLCSSELLAESGLERYRASRGHGSRTGLMPNIYENAASLARQYGVDCKPTSDPASYAVTVPGAQTVTVRPSQFVILDVDRVCAVQKHPATELSPPDPGDAEHYAHLVQQAATNIIMTENIRC